MKKSTFLFIILVVITGNLLANDFVKGNLIIQTLEVLEVLEMEPELITNKEWFNNLVPDYQITDIVHIGEDILPANMLDEVLFYKVVFDTTYAVEDLQQEFDMESEVNFSGPNYLMELYGINTNDFFADDMWGLEKIGLNAVWDPAIGEYGDSDIIVAVIDSGVDLGLNHYPTPHEDLGINLWQDNNGNYGWNPFANTTWGILGNENVNIPQDIYGHGTHVAGTIGAMTNNGIGVAGVVGGWDGTPGCKIMTLRVGGSEDFIYFDTVSIVSALIYAYCNAADVINMSWGGAYDPFLHSFIVDLYTDAYNLGWSPIMIAAAGNYDLETLHYPAAHPEVISVAATDETDRKCMWAYGQGSNYGDWIDICAPGGYNINYPGTTGIYSTTPMDDEWYYCVQYGATPEYDSYNGTSMASPHVAGVAALIKSHFPNLTNQEIKGRLLGSVDDIYQVNEEYLSKLGSGRLNAHNALIESEHPNLTYRNLTIDDGNNEIFECGELVGLEIDLKNWWIEAENVTGVLETEDPNILITYGDWGITYASWGDITQDEVKSNYSLIRLSDSSTTPRIVDFTLHLTADNMQPKDVYCSIAVKPNMSTAFVDLQLGVDHSISTELKISDIDNDGDDELIVGTTENRIYIIDYPNLPSYVNVGTTFNCTPAIGDINNDGYKEIVVGHYDGQILVYDRDLNLLHTYYVDGKISQAIILEDMNGDGQLDIVASTTMFNPDTGIYGFYIINFQNHQISEYDLGYNIKKPISVADINNDDNKDIAILCKDYLSSGGYVSTGIYLKVFEVGDDFSISETFSSTMIGNGLDAYALLSGPVIANIDENGSSEIIFSYTWFQEADGLFSKIVAYNIDSPTPIWDYFHLTSPTLEGEIVVCEIDENHEGLETIYINCADYEDSQIFIFNCYGNLINSSNYSENYESHTIISDINNNGENEIIVCYDFNFKIYDNHCNELEEWEVYTNIENVFDGLGIAEIENNEDYNIILLKMNGSFYKFPIYSNSNSIFEWSQYKNNSRNTGCYYQPLPEDINEDITLKHDTVIEKNTKVLSQTTLTIDDGLEIRFEKNKHLNIFGNLICVGIEDNSINISGLCSNETNAYWNGINLYRGSTSEIEYTTVQNAYNGIQYNDCNGHIFQNNTIMNNKTGVGFYGSSFEVNTNKFSNNQYGICCDKFASPLFGYPSLPSPDIGHNGIFDNSIGVFINKATPSFEDGFNDICNNNLLNMKYNDSNDIQISAQNNWWGSNIESQIIEYLDPVDNFIYDPWCDSPQTSFLSRGDSLSVFQLACINLYEELYSPAIVLFQQVIDDSTNTYEDFLSISYMFICYTELNLINDFEIYLDGLLSSQQAEEFTKCLLHYKGMSYRVNGNFDEAIQLYEDVILNDPSYIDSCYAVIDIGNTYLEANGRAVGRLMHLQPESFESHQYTTQLLLESIRTGDHIQNDIPPVNKYVLHQNYPNPFNPVTTISFSISDNSKVEICIYNIRGQKVKTLTNDEFAEGQHQVIWNSRDNNSKSTASGVYFYKLKVNGKDKAVKKMLLLK